MNGSEKFSCGTIRTGVEFSVGAYRSSFMNIK